MKVSLNVGCLPYAVWKQRSIPVINDNNDNNDNNYLYSVQCCARGHVTSQDVF